MSRDTMREILRKIDKNEDAEQHRSALLRYANDTKYGLGLGLGADATTNEIIKKMLDTVDVDSDNFNAATARGIMSTGARYPLLNTFNVPGMEFFVSSKGSFAQKGTRTNSLNETPMMLNAELMTLFNGDVDGDMAYALFSLMDATAGGLSTEQYDQVLETQHKLQEFSNQIMANMKERAEKRAAIEKEREKTVFSIKKVGTIAKRDRAQTIKAARKTQDVIKDKDYSAFDDAAEKRLGAAIAGMASRKNFGEVGKFDNLRQMLMNFERASGGSLWKLAGQGVGTGAGQVTSDELMNFLATAEFATIFPQEGISSKKVFEKIMQKLDKSNNADWAAMSTEEKENFIRNQFVGIYDKLKDPNTFKSATGLQEIGTMLRDWGLIDDSGRLDLDAASAGRADQLYALMATVTGDKSWLDPKKYAMTWDEIVDRVMKYNASIKGKTYKTGSGGSRKITNGLSDIFTYGKILLPNSKVASLTTIGGMKIPDMPVDQQAALFKLLRYSPEMAAQIFGLTPQQAMAVQTGAPVSLAEDALYRKAYASMTGYNNGVQQDLVEAALLQFNRTKKNPNYIRPSSMGKPLVGSGIYDTPPDRHGQIGFWDQIGVLRGMDYEDIRNVTTADERESLLSLYNSNFMDTNRGQVNNIAQILAMHGRIGANGPVDMKRVWEAYKNSKGSEADFQKALEGLGVSPEGAKSIASEFAQSTMSREELIEDSVKKLGLDASKQYSVDEIQRAAQSLVQSGSDAQAATANAVLSAIDLHAQGGGPARLLKNLETIEALQMAHSTKPNPDSPHTVDSFMQMINTSANEFNGYRVAGREQNLVGFIADAADGVSNDNRIAAIAGSSDMVLAKAGGGVRIADYKAVRNIPKQMQGKYLAQLLSYGYAYNQMRDNIRAKGYASYDDYLKSDENRLYTRMKGAPISKDMFDLMRSDAGYLDEIAVNYTDEHGNARVFVGNYNDIANSAFGQKMMGALIQEQLHPGQPVDWAALTEEEQAFISQRTRASTAPNEYKQIWTKSHSTSAEKRYKEVLEEKQKLLKEEQKIVKLGRSVGASLVLGDESTQDNEYQKQRRAIRDRVDMLDREADAIRKNTKARKEVLDIYDQEAAKVADLNSLEQQTIDTKERQKAAYETFNQSLKDYTGYAQQMVQLEKKAQRATGSDRILLENQMEMLKGYADESLQNLTPDIIEQMSPEQKRKTLVAAERAKKQMDLAAAGMGGGEKQGIFSQFASGLKGGMARSFGFTMLGYRLAGYLGGTIKKILGYAAQLDQAMVNIQIVTGKTRDGAYSLIDSYNDLAKQLGSTTTGVANSANVWLRQGYSVNKVNELITSSLYLSKLGMLDTGTAARDLTGIIKGFKLEVSDATDVVSKLTMIDQNAAVSAGNIATAMQQVSASAQQAGLDIDTTMGYISTIADVSQRDPSSVGASLRTIISRYGTVKAGAFAGMGVDNTTDDLENINDIEKVLRRLGISIRTSTMEFKGLDDVLGTVASRWNEWSSVERNAVATAFAGKYSLVPEIVGIRCQAV